MTQIRNYVSPIEITYPTQGSKSQKRNYYDQLVLDAMGIKWHTTRTHSFMAHLSMFDLYAGLAMESFPLASPISSASASGKHLYNPALLAFWVWENFVLFWWPIAHQKIIFVVKTKSFQGIGEELSNFSGTAAWNNPSAWLNMSVLAPWIW